MIERQTFSVPMSGSPGSHSPTGDGQHIPSGRCEYQFHLFTAPGTRDQGIEIARSRQTKSVGTSRKMSETLYVNPLDSPGCISDWIAEGSLITTFPGGRMRLENALDPELGQAANFLLWCPEVFPPDIRISWDFRPVREPGLAMLWFAAGGRDGRDLFDSALAPRTGEYQQYHSGDIDGYHLSYFRRRLEKERRFHTCNLRKSYGFNLVAHAPDPLPNVVDVVDSYHMALARIDGTIRFSIDGLEIIHWTDRGSSFGPVLGEGRIGFRQMAPLIADYSNLVVTRMERA